MKQKRIFVTAIAAWLFATRIASADEGAASGTTVPLNSPEGYWKTVDDESGKVKSIVYIWKKNNRLYGKIRKLFLDPGQDPNPVCEKCDGSLKGKPVLGMRILWDMVEQDGEWTDGRIMDPENGKTYGCILQVEDGGGKLKVRGFIGVSLLGRTQYWQRTAAPK